MSVALTDRHDGFSEAGRRRLREVLTRRVDSGKIPGLVALISRGDETPSLPHPDLYIDQMVVPDGPPDMLITGGMGQGYDPKTYKADYNP